MSPFQSLPDYEEFVYSLGQEYPEIQSSTLVLARRGPGLATLTGDLCLQGGYRLAVYEILTWDCGTVSIQNYSYEVWKGGQRAYWYDPQPSSQRALTGVYPSPSQAHPTQSEAPSYPGPRTAIRCPKPALTHPRNQEFGLRIPLGLAAIFVNGGTLSPYRFGGEMPFKRQPGMNLKSIMRIVGDPIDSFAKISHK